MAESANATDEARISVVEKAVESVVVAAVTKQEAEWLAPESVQKYSKCVQHSLSQPSTCSA